MALNDPALPEKINELFDRMIREYKRDVSSGALTKGSQVDKDISQRLDSIKKLREKGKDKAAINTEKVVLYLRWLVGDPEILTKPEEVVVY